MKDANLVVSSSPHLEGEATVSQAMWDVVVALIPVTLVSIYFFEAYALFVISVCVVTACVTELIFRKLMGKKPSLMDGSAFLTGLLVAMCFSATTPWWRAALASFIAIGIAKELMGGLGWNRFNPALFGRVSIILLAPLFTFMSRDFAPWSANLGSIDVLTQATPLAMLQQGTANMPAYAELFTFFPGGALSETSALAVLIGGLYLLYKKHIGWRIPVSILATVFLLTLITGQDPIYHLISGGLMLGTFFMATDWVTSPVTDRGKVVFGIAIGVLVVLFRVYLGPTEGVAFSILIMNACVPLIERVTRRRAFSDPEPVRRGAAGEVTASQ